MLLEFANLSRPVLLVGMEEAPTAFASVFRHWPWRPVAWSGNEPDIRISPDGSGFNLSAPWLGKPLRYTDGVNLGCGLGVHVNHAMLLEHPDLLCLHGAGIEIAGHLVVFPNSYRSGKSLLATCLAAAGARVFTDDILPIDRNTDYGVAIGLSPRLRVPLPGTAGDRTLTFADNHAGAGNSQYLYVDLDQDRQAPFGAQSPIGGFVLLERSDGAKARLQPVDDGETLKQLFLRNFARPMPPVESLDYLHGLVARGVCYRLTYSVGDEAADLLIERFSDAAALARDIEAKPPSAVAQAPAGAEKRSAHIRRGPGVGERAVGVDLFLSDSSGEEVYHLNLVGAGLWRLLDGECSVDEAKAVLCEAFPDISPRQIGDDVDRLVGELLKQRLLVLPDGRNRMNTVFVVHGGIGRIS